MPKRDGKPIAIDFFCGAGGLSLGFHRARFDVRAAYDLDPIHIATYSRNFENTNAVQADICTLSAATIRKDANITKGTAVDVVFGGPPCQGFSLIGKRNADDPRNRLLGEFARIVVELNPRYFVIENVAGLMMGAARAELARTLRVLRSGGYRWVTPIRILDAQDYGVPQKRRRVIILGYRRGERKPDYPRGSRHRPTVREAIRDLYCIGKHKSLRSADEYTGRKGNPSGYAKKLGAHNGATLSGCRLAAHDKSTVERFRKTRQGHSEPVSRFVRLRLNGPAPTLRAGTGKDKGSYTAPRPIHPTQHRCITVREAARLHSFPDAFTFNRTQWHGFRQVGNAVPPLLANAVARRIGVALNARRK